MELLLCFDSLTARRIKRNETTLKLWTRENFKKSLTKTLIDFLSKKFKILCQNFLKIKIIHQKVSRIFFRKNFFKNCSQSNHFLGLITFTRRDRLPSNPFSLHVLIKTNYLKHFFLSLFCSATLNERFSFSSSLLAFFFLF